MPAVELAAPSLRIPPRASARSAHARQGGGAARRSRERGGASALRGCLWLPCLVIDILAPAVRTARPHHISIGFLGRPCTEPLLFALLAMASDTRLHTRMAWPCALTRRVLPPGAYSLLAPARPPLLTARAGTSWCVFECVCVCTPTACTYTRAAGAHARRLRRRRLQLRSAAAPKTAAEIARAIAATTASAGRDRRSVG